MSWIAEYTDVFGAWWEGLAEDDQEKVAAAVEMLQEHGPNLKRPIVGKIEGAQAHTHMKELIPPSSNIRVLFAFDPRTAAILLLGGDKTGDWSGWYAKNIPKAETLYTEHLKELKAEGLI